jgi:hypothetical protein
LRRWCFDRATNKDAGRFVASRLAGNPYIDGDAGLFAIAEGRSAVEARVNGDPSFGAGLAALTGGALTAFSSAALACGGDLQVELTFLDESGQRDVSVSVPLFVTSGEVETHRQQLLEKIDDDIKDGQLLVERFQEAFPHLLLGARANRQILEFNGKEVYFGQILRHLRALDAGAMRWINGVAFEPEGVTYSVESRATLEHRDYGPLRDFPTPAGFEPERWSLHTKVTGGPGARIYFRPERPEGGAVILIGYVGPHLPTVIYST